MIAEYQVFGDYVEENAPSTPDSALKCLKEHFSPHCPPVGYLSGRTQMRNAIADETGCSLSRAEHLVEELLAGGHLVYEGDTYAPGKLPMSWKIV